MKQFLESLIKSIVENPDAVVITEDQDQQERQVLIIEVDPSDMGRVIGKSGKVINAVRTIMRVVAIRQGVKVRIDIKDDEQAKPEPTASQEDQTPTTADLVQAPEDEQTSEEPPEKTSDSK